MPLWKQSKQWKLWKRLMCLAFFAASPSCLTGCGDNAAAAPDAVLEAQKAQTLALAQRPVVAGSVHQITLWTGNPKPGNYSYTLRDTGYIEVYDDYSVLTIKARDLTVTPDGSRKAPTALFDVESSDSLVALVLPNDERWYSGLVLKVK